jgi:hypothetical protein
MNPFVFTFTCTAIIAAIGFGALWYDRWERRRHRDSK